MGHIWGTQPAPAREWKQQASLSSAFNAGKVPVSLDFTACSSDARPPPGKHPASLWCGGAQLAPS